VIVDDYIEAFRKLKKLRRETETRRVVSERNIKNINQLIELGLPIKLEFGSYERRGIVGWTYVDKNHNCDLILDVTQPLPFPDKTVHNIYSSHLLEHFTYKEVMAVLAECKRILVSGGSFSVAVPNARLYLESYSNPGKTNIESLCRSKQGLNGHTRIDYVNYMAYMDGYHKYMYDEENLVEILNTAGFKNASLRDFDETIDEKSRDDISIYAEAFK
jgi:predicted SAM-dependent methyltransferase